MDFLKMMRKAIISAYPLPLLVLLVAAVLVIIGSVISWADVRYESYIGNQFRMIAVNGTDVDGYATLPIGTLTLVVVIFRLARRNSSWLLLGGALVLLFIGGVIGITNLFDLNASIGAFSSQNLPSFGAFIRTDVDVGWGLILVTAASWVGLIAVAFQFKHDNRL